MTRSKRWNPVATAVIQFAVTGTLAVLLLGFLAVTLLKHTGTDEAVNQAREITRLAARGVVAPNLTPALERGDPKAIAQMDRVVRRRVLEDPVVRIKVWDRTGRIVYSDDHRLIGSRYPLGEDDAAAFRNGATEAEVSDLSRPENRFERPFHKLLEVYLGVTDTRGRPLLFESYQRFSSISASGRRLWQRFLPALIAALVLLELAQIPLAWRLARRIQRGQREREALLQRAIDASELERRRIAGDLHDGVVQNLAGVAYGLAATAKELPTESATRTGVEEAAGETRRSVRELRSLLVDIYPPTLHRSGLDAALSDLVTGLDGDGMRVQVDVEPGIELSRPAEALVFRAAQETLRNVRAHAGASQVQLSVSRDDGRAVLEVADDGTGFDPAAVAQKENGHFGLRVLHDLARDAGGRFEIDSREGAGTRVRLEVPAE